MTQEYEDLLLKDLCARLPYGVKVQVDNHCWVDFRKDIPVKLTLDNSYRILLGVTLGYVKPYLFPLSSMTDEQKKDIFHNGKFYIDRHNSLCRFPMYEDDYDFVTMEDCLEIFNKLNKYHFDYRGLIPMGLALDATGLNIY